MPSRNQTQYPAATPRYLGERAVVLGGSLSGLITARVLADFYRQVTVVDRDRLTTDAQPRRGLPQGRHAHVLLPRGARVLDELFPGLLEELGRYGAPVARRLDQLHLDVGGHLLSQQQLGGDPQYGASRPLLESTVLRRVKALPNVSLLDEHDVLGLDTDQHRTRVTGVRIACAAAANGKCTLAADLVVAATGRGNQVGSWLTGLGYTAPKEQQLKVDVMYASRRLRMAPRATGGVLGVLVGPTPDRPIGLGAAAQEDNHWVVTLAGFGGHHPPVESNAWFTFAARVAPPWFQSALLGAVPLEEIHTHHFPSNLRRRYDKLQAFPEGLLVVGEAVASLNPMHAQGMTVAALEALALRSTLRGGRRQLAKRFFSTSAKPIDSAWQLAVRADRTMPSDVVPGARPLPLRAVNAYVGSYQKAAEHDPAMALQLLKVTGLAEPSRKLFTPTSLGRVVARRLRRNRDGAEPAVPEGHKRAHVR